ncbi:cation diffusion facilitator family transporter [Thermosphaera chiliense]|uniref:Cation diffusion facilitator family transporter n=1 Tax=Thermosphaera chiliense TaxID=3402707 RepID=A0A7M1UTK0_9CREN|nr:cation diffusion facilitator family transporter [Thermosphaera aggregans]QOR95037.1 cation diffusion facilitator family transporter [Thermosphaera aggregans]
MGFGLSTRLIEARKAFIASALLSLSGVIIEGLALTVYSSVILLTDFFHWTLDTIVEFIMLFSIYYASRVGKKFPWSILIVEFSTSLLVMIVLLAFYGWVMLDYVNNLVVTYEVSTTDPWISLVTIAGGFITFTAFLIQRRNFRRYGLEILRIDYTHALMDTLSSFFATVGVVATALTRSHSLEILFTIILLVFIIHSVLELFKDSFKVLSGTNVDPELTSRITLALEKELYGVRLKTVEARKIGSFYIVSVDVFLDPEMPIYKAHAVKRKIVRLARKESELIYHVDVRMFPDPLLRKSGGRKAPK